MSAKYQRIKQADLALPAPLRWLTRAFSSITLAVCLLCLIVLYGTLASIPLTLLVQAALWAAMTLCTVGPMTLLAYHTLRGTPQWTRTISWPLRALLALVFLAIGAGVCLPGCYGANLWLTGTPWFATHRAQVLYRYPFFEMTEIEFYAWWPMRLLLILFVINMVWATLRRIEFKFANLGVLTVHAGIVTVAVGSLLYGQFKLEGDTLLWRRDLGGGPVDHFYDATTAALFFTLDGASFQIPLDELPRYNDYDPDRRDLNIALHHNPAFRKVFGDRVRATIHGFVSYGELIPQWEPAPQAQGFSPGFPALRVAIGNPQRPFAFPGANATLVAGLPAQRYADFGLWTVEYLANPTQQRYDDLTADFAGEHGLVIDIPQFHFKRTLAIAEGGVYPLEGTPYTLAVEALGDYGMPLVTPGYQGAADTRAMVRVERDGEILFRRIAMFRFPERTQDFIPQAEGFSPGSMGPLGQRTDPDPRLRLTYLDATRSHFFLLQQDDAPTRTAQAQQDLTLLVRRPNEKPVAGQLQRDQDRIPLGSLEGTPLYLYVKDRIAHAVRGARPIVTPKTQRNPKDEGTYLEALLPIDFEVDQPDGSVAARRVWLRHMRYPAIGVADPAPRAAFEDGRLARVQLPGLPATVTLAFSRQRIDLPFAVTLEAFEMQPYPGSDIPRDYLASLAIDELDANRKLQGRPTVHVARLNNPLIYAAENAPFFHRRFKLSQTGWDPGDKSDPDHEARNPGGAFTNQQRYSIIGVGNNVGIGVIFVGACLIVAGIPWAFYVKPALARRRKAQVQRELAAAPG